MSLVFVPYNRGSYQCLSTDISGSKVSGASYIGSDIYVTDTAKWYRVQPDLTLIELVAPSTPASTNSSTQITQNVVADTANSFSGSLVVSGSFVGASTSTLGVAAIQVSMFADKNCTVWIEQGPDGINWDISDEYNYHTNRDFGITVQAINSYCRVIVKNIGVSTATVVRMQTALCPIVESIPRSLTADGNLKVAIQEFEDGYGFGVENTPNDEMRVVTPYRLVGSTFSGSTLDTNYWTQVNGSGSIVVGNAQAILTTGTASSGSVTLQTFRTARYISGASNRARMILNISGSGTANNIRRWGAFTATDGAFFELSGTTFKVVTRKTGQDTPISSGSFNGNYGLEVSTSDFNLVKSYEIYWNNSKVYFTMGGDLLHTYTASSTTWADNLSLPIRFENINSGSSVGVVTMNIRNGCIHRMGSALSQPTSNYTSGQTAGKILKIGNGNLHSLIVGSQATTSVVTLYDGISTGGAIIFSYTYTQGTQANNQPVSLDLKGIPFFTGLFLTITTANSNVLVIYE